MGVIAGWKQSFAGTAAGRWFYGRDVNEQWIITGLVGLVVIVLIWALLWKPVSDWQVVEQNRYENASGVLDWLKANEQKAKALGTSSGAGNRSLIPVITKAAKAHDLKLNRLQPDSNGVISVQLQQQSFNQIVSWLAQLEENNSVTVERASFDPEDSPGYVNAQIRLN